MIIKKINFNKNMCYGYSLESPRRGDSNEYPQHMFLWRNNDNYPLIILKFLHCVYRNGSKHLATSNSAVTFEQSFFQHRIRCSKNASGP